MKKIIFALMFAVMACLAFSSCKSARQNCPAYSQVNVNVSNFLFK